MRGIINKIIKIIVDNREYKIIVIDLTWKSSIKERNFIFIEREFDWLENIFVERIQIFFIDGFRFWLVLANISFDQSAVEIIFEFLVGFIT